MSKLKFKELNGHDFIPTDLAQKYFDDWYEALPLVYGHGDLPDTWSQFFWVGREALERELHTHQGRIIIEGPIEKPCEHPWTSVSTDYEDPDYYKCLMCKQRIVPIGWKIVP